MSEFDSLETHKSYTFELADKLSATNLRSRKSIDSSMELLSEFVEEIKTLGHHGVYICQADFSSERVCARVGSYVMRLAESAINAKAFSPHIPDAAMLAGVTYREPNGYHILHYYLAVLKASSSRLGHSLTEAMECSGWKYSDSFLEIADSIESRPVRGLLDSFGIDLIKIDGEYQFKVRKV